MKKKRHFFLQEVLFLTSIGRFSLYIFIVSISIFFLLIIGISRTNIIHSLTLFLEENYTKENSVIEKEDLHVEHFDFVSDTSITKFLHPDVPFLEKQYIPKNLQSLDPEYIVDTKGNALLIPEAKDHFEHMAKEFFEAFGTKMVVVSTYRSYEYQAGIKARGCSDLFCSKPGHSEHQSGLAIDLWSASNQAYWENNPELMRYFEWLKNNAHKYGFHNTYQKGREVDGYEIEPWHWRYLGRTLATYLQEHDMSFAQLYEQREIQK